MCGEKSSFSSVTGSVKGSPPHVRGKVRFSWYILLGTGITPACAGKRKALQTSLKLNFDHTRMCGEKICFANSIEMELGSPPHVRGKAGCGRETHDSARITPACAGKSCFQFFGFGFY